MTDPNPLVAGNGLKELKAAGIEVVEGVCRDEAEKLNEVFLKWIVHKMPFIVVKTAMTLDGKIATVSGDSKWITNEKSRKFVHQLRDLYDGILIGIGTVLADNPTLTTRLDHLGKNPVRIIVDSKARIPLDSIVITDKSAHTILAVTERASQEKIAALLQVGIEVIVTKEKADRVDLSDLLKILAEKNICSILVEGGSRINYSFFVEHLVDKVHCFIAPKIIGGTDAASPVGGKGTFYMKDAYQLNDITMERFDEDILITGYVR